MSQPFPPTALPRRHTQTVRDSNSSYKIDYIIVIKNFLNPEGHQNPISGLKGTAILLKGWIFPIAGASPGEGHRLQPAQQACFFIVQQFKNVTKNMLNAILYVDFLDLFT